LWFSNIVIYVFLAKTKKKKKKKLLSWEIYEILHALQTKIMYKKAHKKNNNKLNQKTTIANLKQITVPKVFLFV
jgi:hypothetical protein